jgi:hypothetical protein
VGKCQIHKFIFSLREATELFGRVLTLSHLTDKANEVIEPKSSVGKETRYKLPGPWNQFLCGHILGTQREGLL